MPNTKLVNANNGKAKLIKGSKWGCLECTYAGPYMKQVMAKDADGREYSAYNERVIGYMLKCVCGRELTIPRSEFKGKRLMRDCGQCNRAGWGGEHCIMTFSTKVGVKGHIERLARHDGVNSSQLINTFIREGFERREAAADGDEWNLESREVEHA